MALPFAAPTDLFSVQHRFLDLDVSARPCTSRRHPVRDSGTLDRCK